MTVTNGPHADATAGPRIGFIGLGDMGGRIARRIAMAGFPLTVFDVRDAAIEEIVAVGGIAATDIPAVGAASDIVCICVVDDAQVREVVRALLPQAGTTLVIHSSLLPETVRALATGHFDVLDAPVSGSRPAADAGTLTILAGGDKAVLNRLRPLLAAYSTNIIHAGELGSGQLLKIANNVMLHMNHLVAVEAARFARANGISEEALIEAANLSSGRSWVTETWPLLDDMVLDHPLAGTDGVYSIMSKEMWHAVEISRAMLVPMQLTALGTQVSKAYFHERESLVRGRAEYPS